LSYALEFRPSTERDRRNLPLDIQRRFADAFERLLEDPFHPRPGVDIRRLVGGRRGEWRLRVGQYRAVYEVQGSTIYVLEIGHRSNFY
jgi:mRNA-degrading endonuclease RelE of RelBE toxin-antitoxin system